ncbi:MAG TPA: hypothetical protein VKA45_13135 [Gaiellaceae bacterium]|nr:hypothetical protein [Gaiellaceae bacterium]
MLSAYVWSSVVVEMLADEPTWFDRLGVVEVDWAASRSSRALVP